MAGHGRASVADMKSVEIAILLRVSRDEARGDGKTHLSGVELARAMGVSEYRCRAAVERLIKAGELMSERCFRADGSQDPNALSLTAAGKERIAELLRL